MILADKVNPKANVKNKNNIKLKKYFHILAGGRKLLLSLIIGCLIFFLNDITLFAIPSVIVLQNLSFGTFSTSSTSGTVTVSSNGNRTKTGGITLFSSGPGAQAIIRLTDNRGRVVTMTVGTIHNLTDGLGHFMTLAITSFNPASPVYMSSRRINVNIGGRITVGTSATTPKGNYIGSFDIIFNGQ
jgi:hypothetical protein